MTATVQPSKQVSVVSATSVTGKALLPRLKALGYTTTAYVRQPADLPGADTIITDWMHNPAALDALKRADYVIALSGEVFAKDLNVYHEAHVTTTERILSAVDKTRLRRIISYSYVEAAAESPNAYFKANALRENILLNSGIDTVIFRCPTMISTPDQPYGVETAMKAQNGKPVQFVGNGTQRHRPIFRGDVVEATLAALERGQPGIYDLTGPDEMNADALIRLLNGGRDVKISHTPPLVARVVSRFLPDLPPTYVDVMLHDSTGDPSRAIHEFGLKLTSLIPMWTGNGSNQSK